MKKSGTKSMAMAVAMLAAGGMARAATVETISAWDNTAVFSSFGTPDTRYFGQTLTVPSDSQLVSYTFKINQTSIPNTLYTTSVYAWDSVNNLITGSALFSTSGTLVNVSGFADIQATLPGGGLVLTPGQVILLMFEATGTSGEPGDGAAGFGLTPPESLADGAAWVLNRGSELEPFLPDVNEWGPVGGDFAFRAEFAFIPEPSTYAACGFLAGAVAWRWRLRRKDR